VTIDDIEPLTVLTIDYSYLGGELQRQTASYDDDDDDDDASVTVKLTT